MHIFYKILKAATAAVYMGGRVVMYHAQPGDISIGMVQSMLLYWSLWPEPINTVREGETAGEQR